MDDLAKAREKLEKALTEGFVPGSCWGVAAMDSEQVVEALDKFIDEKLKAMGK